MTENNDLFKSPDEIAREKFVLERIEHWDYIAKKNKGSSKVGSYYHNRLIEYYRFLIPENKRVLDLGCGQGKLLASLKPSYGVGVDFSGGMIELASSKYPDLQFVQTDIMDFETDEEFDYIILSDVPNDLWDVQSVLVKMNKICTRNTRLILNFYNHFWEKPLVTAQHLKMILPTLSQNWLSYDDVENLLKLSDFEVVRKSEEIMFPLSIPLLAPFLNKFLVKLWPFRKLAIANIIVARAMPKDTIKESEPVVSVIVPARNEAGNIANIFTRTPEMGAGTELIFIEGHSSDNTYEVIEKTISENPERKCKLFRQAGKGKGDAVRLGFAEASGDILMILDADLTVPPEDLPKFYDVIRSGKAEFVNGVRLVYPMEKEAMRFFNLIGNKFFSMAFTWLMGQFIKDTLCGTKVISKENYGKIAENRNYFGDFDPFGDFDLLFGAAKLNLKMVDLPIRYRERVYGDTNIQRWRHGLLLLKMVIFAAKRIKFV